MAAVQLLDLPDQCLTQILIALPTPQDLLAACTSTRALKAVVSDECWQKHSETKRWLVRRRQESSNNCLESCEAHFRRAHTTSSTVLIIGGDQGASQVDESTFVEVFDHVASSWLRLPAGPPAPLAFARWRNAPCAACDRGIGYIVGGWDDDEEEALADVLTFRLPQLLCEHGEDGEMAIEPRAAGPAIADVSDQADGGPLGVPSSAGAHAVAAAATAIAPAAHSVRRWRWPPGARPRSNRITARSTQPLQLPPLPEPRCFAAATFDAGGTLWVVGGGDAMTRGASCMLSLIHI